MIPLTLTLGFTLLAPTADPAAGKAAYDRGLKHQRERDYAEAAKAFSEAIAADPKLSAAYDRRGDAYLKLGKFVEAVADYDAYLKADPMFAPEHWRRGIALYYTDKFADGAKQFEKHKEANPQDVENAAWHYLCNARVIGKEKARKDLIAVTQDRRVPMAQIQKLFAGVMKPEEVLKVAESISAKTDAGIESRFYGHLYIGLWYEAEGDAAKAKEHIEQAVKHKIGHFMWDIAKVHADVIKAREKEKEKNKK